VFVSLCAAAARASPLQDGIASPAQATRHAWRKIFCIYHPQFSPPLRIKGPPTGTGAAPAKTKGQVKGLRGPGGHKSVGGRVGALVCTNCRLRLLKTPLPPTSSVVPVSTLLSFLSLSLSCSGSRRSGGPRSSAIDMGEKVRTPTDPLLRFLAFFFSIDMAGIFMLAAAAHAYVSSTSSLHVLSSACVSRTRIQFIEFTVRNSGIGVFTDEPRIVFFFKG
jgi:hypothetical protein